MIEARIKLAKAMGYVVKGGDIFALSDPFTDANDCDALIKHLNGLGWDINIWFSGNADSHRSNVSCRVRARFRDGSKDRYDIPCDNWMRGVCELALKVLEIALEAP